MRKYFAAILFCLSSWASATVVTFDDLAEGTVLNGQTFQGLTFHGGVIKHSRDGAYISGRTMMTFASGSLGNRLNFMADGWHLDSMTWTYKGNERYEPWMIESMSYQPPGYGIPEGRIPGYYQGKTWLGRIFLEDGVTGIGWNTWALSELSFTAPPQEGGASNGVISAEVPEPSGSLIFLIGLLSLIGWRRQGQFQLAQQAT